jgi:hypothetical protein
MASVPVVRTTIDISPVSPSPRDPRQGQPTRRGPSITLGPRTTLALVERALRALVLNGMTPADRLLDTAYSDWDGDLSPIDKEFSF